MKIFRLLTILTVILVFSNAYSNNDKKIYLFPIQSEAEQKNICKAFTEMLKQKFIQTGVFDVNYTENFSFKIDRRRVVFEGLKNKVDQFCENSDMKLVVFGYLIKQSYDYSLKIVLYSTKSGNVIDDFSEYFEDPENLDKIARQCAIDFAHKIRTQKASNMMLYSAICPGLGQFVSGSKFKYRGLLYFTGFTYFFIKYVSLGREKITSDWSQFNIRRDGGAIMLTIEGGVFDYGTWLWRMKENAMNIEFNNQLKKDRNAYFAYVGIIYALNLIDALLTSNKYNNRVEIEKRVSLDVRANQNQSLIGLNFKF